MEWAAGTRTMQLKSDVVELAGIYDIKPERCALAEKNGIHAYESMDALLSDESVDLVTVAIPNDVHKDVVIQCLLAGKNVICEKPVALSSAEFAEMVDAAAQERQAFYRASEPPLGRGLLAMKQLYQSGEIGEVFNIESRIHGSRGIPSDWRGEKEYGGGMLLDWGSASD